MKTLKVKERLNGIVNKLVILKTISLFIISKIMYKRSSENSQHIAQPPKKNGQPYAATKYGGISQAIAH